MAESGKIKSTDVIEQGLYDDAIKSTIAFQKETTTLIEGLKEVLATSSKFMKANRDPKTAEDLKKLNKVIDENKKARLAVLAIEKQQIAADIQLEKLKQQQLKTSNQQAAASKKEAEEARKLAKAIEDQNSAYKRATKELSDVKKKLKDLSVQGKESSAEYKQLDKVFKDLDKSVRKAEEGVGEFQRSVGTYKDKMKEAIDESEAFSKINDKLGEQGNLIAGSFGKVIKTLKDMKKAQDASASGFSKMGTAFKASGIAILITLLTGIAGFMNQGRESALKFEIAMSKWMARLSAVMGGLANIGSGLLDLFNALGKVFKGDFKGAAAEASKGIDSMKHSFDDFGKKVDDISGKIEELARLTFKYEDDIRALQLALADTINNEGDLAEIAADTTIGYKERNKALEDGAVLRRKIAEDELTIATKQRELAEKQVALEKAKNNGDVSSQALENLNQLLIAEKNAIDKREDLKREEAQRNRAFLQEQTLNEIELLRSKKLNADAAVQILTKQLADEKYQLEERQDFASKLARENRAEVEKEFKTLSKTFTDAQLKRINLQELIATTDAKELQDKIHSYDLYVAGETELAKIITQAQQDELSLKEQLKKLDEERLARLEKIADIQRQIDIANKQAEIDATKSLLDEKVNEYEEANKLILENENVFNAEMERQREKAFEQEKMLLEEETKLRKQLLNQQESDEKLKAEQTINDQQILAQTIAEIENKYRIEREKLDRDDVKTRKELDKKEADEKRAIELKKTEIILDELSKVSSAIADELDKRAQREQEKYDREITKRNEQIDKQRELAARGLDNQLAYEEAKRDKALLAKQDAEEKAERKKEMLQLTEAYFNSLNARLQSGSNPSQAPALALGDTLLAKGVAKGLVQFAKEGNEDVQPIGMGGQDGVDDIPFLLTRGEAVITKKANKEHKGVSKALNNGTFKELYMPKIEVQKQLSTAEQIANSIYLQTNSEMVGLLKAIKDKPVHQFNVDGMGNIIETVYTNGKKDVIKHIQNRKRI